MTEDLIEPPRCVYCESPTRGHCENPQCNWRVCTARHVMTMEIL